MSMSDRSSRPDFHSLDQSIKILHLAAWGMAGMVIAVSLDRGQMIAVGDIGVLDQLCIC